VSRWLDTTQEDRMKYERPLVIRFGTFRELTQQNGKKDAGTDLANAFGTSCNVHAQTGSSAACSGSSASF
jgi:hypothetical protein